MQTRRQFARIDKPCFLKNKTKQQQQKKKNFTLLSVEFALSVVKVKLETIS